ncbi:MAG: YjbH domain-containing protein [Candidatus Latescibacteria bacterium]|nr:YjbH domain-containing protein [Candidatus Latescibacterota bacterium]
MLGLRFCVVVALLVVPVTGWGEVALIGTSGLLTIPTAETVRDGRIGWGMAYIPPGHYTHFLDPRIVGSSPDKNRSDEGKQQDNGKRPSGKYTDDWQQRLERLRRENLRTFSIVPMWVSFGYLPFMELTVRLTAIPDALPPAPNIGIYKDGMAAVHVRLVPEWRYGPAIAGGIRDFYGFGVFPASYFVGTKTVRVMDQTVRIHLGRGFRDWPSGEWGAVEPEGSHPKEHSFVGWFGGTAWSVRQDLSGMLEYDTRRMNVGIRWRPRPWGTRHTQMDVGLFGFTRLFGGIAFHVDLL